MTAALSKRALLQTLAGLTVVSVAGIAQAKTPALSAIDPAGAADIGRAWLEKTPATAVALRAELVPASDDTPARLKNRVRDDFRADRMFVHKGWFLSETEAKLCALISLS